MKVFESSPVEGWEWVVAIDWESGQVLRSIGGVCQGNDWKPIEVKRILIASGEQLMEADCPWLGSHVLVLTDRSKAAVGSLLEEFGELLPLKCSGAVMWLFNACRVVDALDEEASDITRFRGSEKIMRISKYEFRRSVLRNEMIFKIPQMLNGPIFLTSGVVELLEQLHLTGLGFAKVWEDNP